MYIFITSNADKFVDSFPWSLGLRVLERQDTELSEDSFNFFIIYFSKKNFQSFFVFENFQKKIRKNVQKNFFLNFF